MMSLYSRMWLCLAGIAFFASCAGTPHTTKTAGMIPEMPAYPPIPEKIMGKGLIFPENMAQFLLNANPWVERDFVDNLVAFYIEEANAEGVNYDTAFAQMCLETGFLSYGGLVTPDMNNFCGLGAIGPGQNGEYFPDPRTGVRAHIQPLKAYATDAPLNQELVDPRYRWVRYGSSPSITGLSGTWAADKDYAVKINSILERLYIYAFTQP
ncbi:MAG: glucosaminidase domain-containing protein [Treponema sp.]|nr:glucosaminidase domain-containing protein [Treponema sp.]